MVTTQTGGLGRDVFRVVAVGDDGVGSRVEVMDFRAGSDQVRLEFNPTLRNNPDFLDAITVFAILDADGNRVLNGADGATTLGSITIGVNAIELQIGGDVMAVHGAIALAFSDWSL